jgi:signal transduction histidine kinase
MGLAVCFRIVHSMKGTIEVESKPGQGADFRIVLAKETPEAPEAPTLPKQAWENTGWVPKLPPQLQSL